ncbi:MAG: VOC family protein, partial [Gammaproteobacteria bacterium]
MVVMVKDLDGAADAWRALGFTVSPRGTHSAQMGSGNYTIMLHADYIELLGILHDTPRNATARAFLERRGEGIERAAFTTRNAIEGIEALRARGIQATGPIEFSRPVDLPDGAKTEAAFSVFDWPAGERPGDLRIFACQHHTRHAVWVPSLQSHANTANRILRVEVLASRPEEAARHLAHLIDVEVAPDEGGAMRVLTAPGRGEFLFL